MKKRKYQGHYCKICGRIRANEKYSGSGHASHVCKDCAKLPKEKRNELQTITRIHSLPFWLKKEQRAWLEEKRKDPREKVRAAADAAYEDRFGWAEEQRRADDELEAYLSESPDERERPTDGERRADEALTGTIPTDRFPADSEFQADRFPPDVFPPDGEFLTDKFPPEGEFLTDGFRLPTNEIPSNPKINDDALPFK